MQPLPESLFGYQFTEFDGAICRASYRSVEDILDAGMDEYEAAGIELAGLYETAFLQMTTFGINLVDN